VIRLVSLLCLLASSSLFLVGQTHTYREGEKVFIPGKGLVTVTTELSAMLEFYRGVALHMDGDAAAGRAVLQNLITANRIKTVHEDAYALVVGYAEPTSEMRRSHPRVPWERVARIRMLDGEAPGLEVWVDDSDLRKVQ
jgi:hypothetical protein